MIASAVCVATVLMSFQVGASSHYRWPGDRQAGRTLMCHRYLEPGRFRAALGEGCAHRFLPCGTRLLVEDLATNRSGTCTVVDRGPYGAIYHGRWLLKRRYADPGDWRGVLDVLPPVATRLGLHGLHPVLLQVVAPGPRPVPRRAAKRPMRLLCPW